MYVSYDDKEILLHNLKEIRGLANSPYYRFNLLMRYVINVHCIRILIFIAIVYFPYLKF